MSESRQQHELALLEHFVDRAGIEATGRYALSLLEHISQSVSEEDKQINSQRFESIKEASGLEPAVEDIHGVWHFARHHVGGISQHDEYVMKKYIPGLDKSILKAIQSDVKKFIKSKVRPERAICPIGLS